MPYLIEAISDNRSRDREYRRACGARVGQSPLDADRGEATGGRSVLEDRQVLDGLLEGEGRGLIGRDAV